jgi:hypothetical protein
MEMALISGPDLAFAYKIMRLEAFGAKVQYQLAYLSTLGGIPGNFIP